jgi:hypothetical protein
MTLAPVRRAFTCPFPREGISRASAAGRKLRRHWPSGRSAPGALGAPGAPEVKSLGLKERAPPAPDGRGDRSGRCRLSRSRGTPIGQCHREGLSGNPGGVPPPPPPGGASGPEKRGFGTDFTGGPSRPGSPAGHGSRTPLTHPPRNDIMDGRRFPVRGGFDRSLRSIRQAETPRMGSPASDAWRLGQVRVAVCSYGGELCPTIRSVSVALNHRKTSPWKV